MMPTPKEVLLDAYALLGGWGFAIPGMPESILYLQMSQRQQELFAQVNALDPEFFGSDVEAPVANGRVDLYALVGGQGTIQSVQVVLIDVPGPSNYEKGDRVRIVRTDDQRDLPPRVLLRDGTLIGVEEDLDGVQQLRVYYSRKPTPITITGEGLIQIPEPYVDLLALDLAKYILNRDMETASSPAMAYFVAEEEKRLASLEAHVRANYRALESRFG
jgi:hypothetical protein